jgi:hypothetical protein
LAAATAAQVVGEEAGGAFFGGLRYEEGVLYTKNAGDLKLDGKRHCPGADPVGCWVAIGRQCRVFEIHAAVDLESVLTVAVRRGSLTGTGPNGHGSRKPRLKRQILQRSGRTGAGSRSI